MEQKGERVIKRLMSKGCAGEHSREPEISRNHNSHIVGKSMLSGP